MVEKETKKYVVEMIIIGVVLAVVVFIFMSNTGDQEFAAAAANARVPLSDVFKGLLNKYF